VVTRNNLAWLLATHPHPRVCDPEQAVLHAERASQLSKRGNVTCEFTLAVAYAAADDYHRAAEVAQRALDLATDRGSHPLAEPIRQRLEYYRQAKPYPETPTGKKAE